MSGVLSTSLPLRRLSVDHLSGWLLVCLISSNRDDLDVRAIVARPRRLYDLTVNKKPRVDLAVNQ